MYALRAAAKGDTFYVQMETGLDMRTRLSLSVTLDPRHTLSTREGAERSAARAMRIDPSLVVEVVPA